MAGRARARIDDDNGRPFVGVSEWEASAGGRTWEVTELPVDHARPTARRDGATRYADREGTGKRSTIERNNISAMLGPRRTKALVSEPAIGSDVSTASGGPPWFGEALPSASFSGVLVTFASWGRSPRRRAQTQKGRGLSPGSAALRGYLSEGAELPWLVSLVTPRGAEATHKPMGGGNLRGLTIPLGGSI
jgi:hypothetical protein